MITIYANLKAPSTDLILWILLGLWLGSYQGIERLWLRWHDGQGNWIFTPEEEERQRAEQLKLENARLRELLPKSGLQVPEIGI